jgi:hypothetical protein
MWANKSICSYSDFNLAYVAEFQYKAFVILNNLNNNRLSSIQ